MLTSSHTSLHTLAERCTCERADTCTHRHVPRYIYRESGGHIYVHSDDDTYNALPRIRSSLGRVLLPPPHRTYPFAASSIQPQRTPLLSDIGYGEAAAGPRKGTGTGVRETGRGAGGERELKGGSRSVSRGSREKLGFISRARGTVARG